jgi:dTMP kinase
VNRGRFIVLEGPDGVGKSTQAARLAGELGAVLTREPGGTAIGSHLRELLLDRGSTGLDPKAEALLMAADRAQHVAEVVRPALTAGRHVVADRYLYSSVAYQAYGRGLPAEHIRRLSLWASDGLEPDLVVLLDGPRRRTAGDRLEDEDAAFHERVAAGYRAQAAADPERWVVIDARRSIEETEALLLWAVRDRLGLHDRAGSAPEAGQELRGGVRGAERGTS